MKQEYFDESGYCPRCPEYTLHYYYIQGHERDSSQDYQVCLECGLTQTGYGDDYEADNETLDRLRRKYEILLG